MNINETVDFLQYPIPEDILRRKMHGDFEGAVRLIDRRLKDESLPQALRGALEIQKMICRTLPDEFPYTKAQAMEIIHREIPDFTEAEFDALVDDRHICWIYVQGEMRYFNRFYSSLCKAVPEFGRRARQKIGGMESITADPTAANLRDVTIAKMKQRGSLTTRIRIRATVKLKDEFFRPGTFVRAHLPIPAICDQQQEVRIEKIWPESGRLSQPDAMQRTVCWEETMEENHEFAVEYTYLHRAVYKDAYHTAGEADKPLADAHDVQQLQPHITFTPYIRSLCAELTEGCSTALDKARAIYDHITKNMYYTYMPEYVTLENLSENCALSNTGDCGVFALLFITLCRCAGIPAQWQSGLTVEPDFIGGHDWVRFYAEPYGWIFADPSYGVSAMRAGNEQRRQFYFGNLDPYRMVANRAFQASFEIPKNFLRADPYDNQLGEIETETRGFRFGEYLRSKEILLCEEAEE